MRLKVIAKSKFDSIATCCLHVYELLDIEIPFLCLCGLRTIQISIMKILPLIMNTLLFGALTILIHYYFLIFGIRVRWYSSIQCHRFVCIALVRVVAKRSRELTFGRGKINLVRRKHIFTFFSIPQHDGALKVMVKLSVSFRTQRIKIVLCTQRNENSAGCVL